MYLSQSKLSTLAGLSRITAGDIEERRNQGNVGILTIEKLAKVLRVSPAWLAFGIGPRDAIEQSEDDPPGQTAIASGRGPHLDQ